MTAHSTGAQFRAVLRDTFEEIALCLGGIFLTHRTKADLVEVVMTSLEEIYERVLEASGEASTTGIEARLHPAVEKFLRHLEAASPASPDRS